MVCPLQLWSDDVTRRQCSYAHSKSVTSVFDCLLCQDDPTTKFSLSSSRA